MAMPIPIPQPAAPRYTVDDIASWPDDGNRYELLDGVLLVTPSPGLPHQLAATEIARLLAQTLEPFPAVRVCAPGVIVRRPDTELQPDVLVLELPVGAFRWERVRRHLLAVEVISRSTRVYDRDYKRPAYLTLGVEEVWRVDLDRRMVLVSRPGLAADQPVRDVLSWNPGGTGQTFAFDVAALLRGL